MASFLKKRRAALRAQLKGCRLTKAPAPQVITPEVVLAKDRFVEVVERAVIESGGDAETVAGQVASIIAAMWNLAESELEVKWFEGRQSSRG